MIANEFVRPELLVHKEGVAVNPLVAQLIHLPFPEVAETLRMMAGKITLAWDEAVRAAMSQMRRLTFEELKDSTPQILLAIADALGSDDPAVIRTLVSCAPGQGLSRFRMNFDVVEVMQEDRLLRAIIVDHVEAGMGHRLSVTESAALHAAIDLMLQRSVIALVEEQKSVLRVAAETELKFLSFLAHDLNNNLNNVTLLLSDHAADLTDAGGFPEAVQSLSRAQRSIEATVVGMRQMLDHERLRKSSDRATPTKTDLHDLATVAVLQFANAAASKGLKVDSQARLGTVIESDGELIAVVLQNLVGNAIKYSSSGTISIGAGKISGRQSLWVADQGPGIAPEKLDRIFDAFRRGEVHNQWGVGLGLAIASQGAHLLGATLSVTSSIGQGSTFTMCFAPEGGTESTPHLPTRSLLQR